MIKSMLRILSFAIVLLIGIAIKHFLESLWLVFTGLDSNGLSSLVALIAMAFSFTLFLPLKDGSRIRMNRLFKEVFIFSFIWISVSFSMALLHQPKHVSIGLIPALFYVFLRLSIPTIIGLKVILEEYSEIRRDDTILMWVAPTPRIFVTQGIGLRSILGILRGKAKATITTSGDLFVKSFKNIRIVELQGSLASFVRTVADIWNREVAIVCEAKPEKGLFKLRVKIASDDKQVLNNIVKNLSKLDGKEDLKWALEKWLSLKPCVKPIKLANSSVLLKPGIVPERLFVAGSIEEAERFALQACLSQLRSNSMILIINGEEDPVFESKIEKALKAECFKPNRSRLRTFAAHGKIEAVLIRKTDLKEKLIRKISSKPLVAVWLRECSEDLDLNTPLKVLTCSMHKPILEADGLLLLDPDKSILDSFIPARYGFSLQGKTVMVSANGVRILT
ncbi:MAG: hypothetical protein QXT26_00360 [Thermoproteota archaeon]